ncbi:MAG TPA: hypothetical protein VNJ01_07380 [Bacteriovoracaceae bacterium]|nr:hypothetical protein [Bacteriovoracaceae bacterium]
MKYIICFLLSLSSQGFAQSENLARFYAPTVVQGEGTDPQADQFTKVDFDHDWVGDNNWKNMLHFPRPRTVYYDVIEGEKHYFITYAFFYPRDYAAVCFWVHCHENDLEGMKVVVEKPNKIVRMETLAHNYRKVVLNPKEISIVIEKEGHGIHPKGLRKPDKKNVVYQPQDYDLLPIKDLWNKRNSQVFKGSFLFRGKRLPSGFRTSKWSSSIGGARPPWSWEVKGLDRPKGTWFLDPAAGTNEKYISNTYLNELFLPELATIK